MFSPKTKKRLLIQINNKQKLFTYTYMSSSTSLPAKNGKFFTTELSPFCKGGMFL